MYRRIQVSVHPLISFPMALLFVTKHILCFEPTQTTSGCASAIPVVMHVAQTILARSHICHAWYELQASTSTRSVVHALQVVCMTQYA